MSHAVPVATERHQPGNDGRLAEADAADDNHAAIGGGVGSAQLGVNLLEQPITACEDRIHGDAGHLEEEGLESYVLETVRSKAHCGRRERER